MGRPGHRMCGGRERVWGLVRGDRITGGWRPSPPWPPLCKGGKGTTGAFAGVMCGGRERVWGLVRGERITGGWRCLLTGGLTRFRWFLAGG